MQDNVLPTGNFLAGRMADLCQRSISRLSCYKDGPFDEPEKRLCAQRALFRFISTVLMTSPDAVGGFNRAVNNKITSACTWRTDLLSGESAPIYFSDADIFCLSIIGYFRTVCCYEIGILPVSELLAPGCGPL